MKLVILATSLIALSLLGADLSTSLRAEQGGCGRVRPEIFDAFVESPKVLVSISLEGPAGWPETATIFEMRGYTAAAQDGLIAALDSDPGSAGGEEIQVLHRHAVIPGMIAEVSLVGAEKLDCQPGVDSVGPTLAGSPALTESSPLINADDETITVPGLDGAGVRVVVIDSGIDSDHPDLASSISYAEGACFTDACPSSGHAWEDSCGHGTHVSGIIASDGVTTGVPKGIAPGATILPYRVFDVDETGHCGGVSAAWEEALDYALAQQCDPIVMSCEIDLVNMSVQSAAFEQPMCNNYFPNLRDPIQALRQRGVLTFAAAGNQVLTDKLSIPACIFAAIAVGAAYDADMGSINHVSDSGNKLCTDSTTKADKVVCFSNSAETLDLLAPGSRILSTWPFGYPVKESSGTSQASPMAVGVAALIKEALPSLTADQLEERITQGVSVRDHRQGRLTHRIDARAAVLEANPSADFDGDGCPNFIPDVDPSTPGDQNGGERSTVENKGGKRNALNPYDYFNPTADGVNRVDDILAVVNEYFNDDPPDTPDLGSPTDRTSIPVPPAGQFNPSGEPGGDVWDLGAPNGQQRVDDILAAVKQYFHDC